MSKSNFRTLLLSLTFAKNAKVTGLLKNEKTTDLELAAAVKSTKAYKENLDLQAEVATIIAGTPEPKKEPEKVTSGCAGEPRMK